MGDRVEYVFATRKDIETFHPDGFPWTFRAGCVRVNGETLGIGGVYYDGDYVIAFSKFKPELNNYPLVKARALIKVMEIVRNHPCIAIADVDNFPEAPKLLERLGFAHVEGRIYRWMQHKSVR